MNKKGFTLIEVLAVIIIIGIISTIGITAISGNIDKSRRSNFANLARTYAEAARTMRAEDRLPIDVKNREGILISVDKLDVNIENDDYTTSYGDIVLEKSYVFIVNEEYKFKYYVTLIDNTNHAIVNTEYSEIDENSIVIDGDKSLSKILNIPSLTKGKWIEVGKGKYNIKSIYNNYIYVSL